MSSEEASVIGACTDTQSMHWAQLLTHLSR